MVEDSNLVITKDVITMCKEKNQIEYPTGIKWTKQRKDVYEVILGAHEPLSALQIYNSIAKNAQTANYAVSTIYRILATFEEHGIVNKTASMRDGMAIYERKSDHHTHYAVCLDCHKRVPMQACPITHIDLDGQDDSFTITDHKLEVYGYCKHCNETHKKN